MHERYLEKLHLEGLLCKIDILNSQQPCTERWHCSIAYNGGCGGGQHICKEGQASGSQDGDVIAPLRVEQVHLDESRGRSGSSILAIGQEYNMHVLCRH